MHSHSHIRIVLQGDILQVAYSLCQKMNTRMLSILLFLQNYQENNACMRRAKLLGARSLSLTRRRSSNYIMLAQASTWFDQWNNSKVLLPIPSESTEVRTSSKRFSIQESSANSRQARSLQETYEQPMQIHIDHIRSTRRNGADTYIDFETANNVETEPAYPVPLTSSSEISEADLVNFVIAKSRWIANLHHHLMMMMMMHSR